MAKKNKASNEAIITALLAHGTKRAAAEALGIGEQTIYERMKKAEFKALYAAARADVLREAVVVLGKSLLEAVNTVNEIMADKENNPAIRLQAAQTIISNVGKLGALVTEAEAKTEQEQQDAFLTIF